jgi:hypothetical protein
MKAIVFLLTVQFLCLINVENRPFEYLNIRQNCTESEFELNEEGYDSIKRFLFDSCPMLEKLILKEIVFINYLNDTNAFFSTPSNLRHLELAQTNISSIGKDFFIHMTKLKHLDLQDNKLDSVNSYTFDHLTALEDLNLGWNRIKFIREEAFHKLVNLEKLLISGNDLRSISSMTFKNLCKLKILDLDANYLTDFDPLWLSDLKRLEHLDFKNNEIRVLGNLTILESLKHLNYLDLFHNLIETEISPKVFGKNLKALHTFRVGLNKIVYIDFDWIMNDLTNLGEFNMCNNSERLNNLTKGRECQTLASLKKLYESGKLKIDRKDFKENFWNENTSNVTSYKLYDDLSSFMLKFAKLEGKILTHFLKRFLA